MYVYHNVIKSNKLFDFMTEAQELLKSFHKKLESDEHFDTILNRLDNYENLILSWTVLR